MVIQRLEEVKALLDKDPPDVNLARIVLLVAMEELRKECRSNTHAVEVLREIPIRDQDALLKEFGW